MQRGGTLGPSESGTHGCVQPVHRTHARRSRYETAPIAARGGTPHFNNIAKHGLSWGRAIILKSLSTLDYDRTHYTFYAQ